MAGARQRPEMGTESWSCPFGTARLTSEDRPSPRPNDQCTATQHLQNEFLATRPGHEWRRNGSTLSLNSIRCLTGPVLERLDQKFDEKVWDCPSRLSEPRCKRDKVPR